jgi:hypothetical protein
MAVTLRVVTTTMHDKQEIATYNNCSCSIRYAAYEYRQSRRASRPDPILAVQGKAGERESPGEQATGFGAQA